MYARGSEIEHLVKNDELSFLCCIPVIFAVLLDIILVIFWQGLDCVADPGLADAFTFVERSAVSSLPISSKTAFADPELEAGVCLSPKGASSIRVCFLCSRAACLRCNASGKSDSKACRFAGRSLTSTRLSRARLSCSDSSTGGGGPCAGGL